MTELCLGCNYPIEPDQCRCRPYERREDKDDAPE